MGGHARQVAIGPAARRFHGLHRNFAILPRVPGEIAQLEHLMIRTTEAPTNLYIAMECIQGER